MINKGTPNNVFKSFAIAHWDAPLRFAPLNTSLGNKPMNLLDSIEWHDLPVSELSITESGLSVTITPYIESSHTYLVQVLRITQAESISLQITGALLVSDLGAIEVSSFSYSLAANGRLNGTIEFLPGQAGYWRASFANAVWELTNA